MRTILPPGWAKRKEGDGLDEARSIRIRAKSLTVELPSLNDEPRKLNGEAQNLNGELRKLIVEARKLNGEPRRLVVEARKLNDEARKLIVEAWKLKGEAWKLDVKASGSKLGVRGAGFRRRVNPGKKECLPRPDTIRYTLEGSPRNAPPMIYRRIVDSPGLQ
jgi:hypothetical protein